MGTIARAAAATFAATLVLVSCGGDGNGANEGGEAENGAEDSVTVTAENFSFDPQTIDAGAGAEVEVTFENRDSATHSFTITDLDVDLEVEGGESDSVTFTAPDSGSVDFFCRFHRQMQGTVSVDGGSGGGESEQDRDDMSY